MIQNTLNVRTYNKAANNMRIFTIYFQNEEKTIIKQKYVYGVVHQSIARSKTPYWRWVCIKKRATEGTNNQRV